MWIAAALVLALGASGCVTMGKAPKISVTVLHGQTRKVVRVPSGSTLGAVLDRAHDAPSEGSLRSVVANDRLGPNGHAGRISVRGRTARRSLRLHRATTVRLTDGSDSVEQIRSERRPLQPDGFPDALQHVFDPGRAGEEEVTLGVRSGEVVRRRTIRPAVPAHRAPGKVIALTFDDGPDPRWTPQILDILKANHVPAAFCQIGIKVDEHPELSRRILGEGHQLCNHTAHHVERLEQRPAAEITSEIDGGRDSITTAAGEAPPFYRPPGGTLAPVIYDAAASPDEQVLYWSIDPRDWRATEATTVAGDVVRHLEPGAIVLLHDGGGIRSLTVAALPLIIAFARALGYSFTLPLGPPAG